MAWIRQYSALNAVCARKLKALIIYMVNPHLYEKRSLCVFEPLFGGLGAMYAVHLRLIGKPLEDFLLVIIELFSHGVTADETMSEIDWKFEGVGHFGPKFQVEGDITHQQFVHS